MKVDTVRFPGTDLTVRLVGPDGAEARGLVVFCHGFGAPGTDLVGLAPELMRLSPGLGELAFAFPEAPLSPPDLAPFGGRAWWELDVPRLDAMIRAGKARDLANEKPEGLASARRMLRATCEALLRHYDLPARKMVLGGFSQGAMLTTDTALRLEEAPAALIVMSGTLINVGEWTQLAPRRAGLPTLISHGEQDPLLPFFAAEALRDLLSEAGLDVRFVPFMGQHTIAMNVLEAAAAMLSGALLND